MAAREFQRSLLVLPDVPKRSGMKIVAARSLRNHHRGPRGPAQSREVARTSEPRRPAHQYRRQACRTDRLRAAFLRFQGDRVRDLKGARNGAQSRLAYAFAFTPDRFAVSPPGACYGLGSCGWHIWPGGASGRTAGVALGGRSGSADASESGYFAVRGMLAKTVTEAARFVAERGVLKEGAPILLKFHADRCTLRISGHAEGCRASASRPRPRWSGFTARRGSAEYDRIAQTPND